MYIPYLIYYSFPGLSARGVKRFDFKYHFSFYYTNDIFIEKLEKENDIITATLGRDYESLVVENGISFCPLKNLEIGTDFRFVSYYGGFMDQIIEGYHSAFGFPNGGRDYIKRNQVYVNITNNNNVKLNLTESSASLGDIDLWAKYTFYEMKWISLAAFGAFKIPAGNINYLSGSGYPDIAFGVLSDFRPVWILSFYLQAGLVIPYDSFLPNIPSKPYPMFNGMAGIELNPFKVFSLIAQFNIKSSPLRSDISHWYFINADYLALPQLNILVGLVFEYKDFRWQFYFEEDTFTNAGTDLTLNLSFSHKLNFNFGL